MTRTFSVLLNELGEACVEVQALIYKLDLPNLSPNQKAYILADLLAAVINLQYHCKEDFQKLISDEMENLHDQE